MGFALVALVWFCWAGAFHLSFSLASPLLAFLGAIAWAGLMERANLRAWWSIWLLGTAFNLAILYWMPDAAVHYYSNFNLTHYHGVIGWVAVSIFNGLQFNLAWFVTTRLVSRGFCRQVIATPLGWLVGELLFYRPFPWYLGATQINITPLAATGELLGVPFVSFLLLLIASLCWDGFRNRRSWGWVIMVVLTLLGWAEIRHEMLAEEISKAAKISVGMVQGNDPILKDQSEELVTERIKTYQQLTSLLSPTPDFIVWPEGSVLRTIAADEKRVATDFQTGLPQLRRSLIFAGKLGVIQPHSKRPGFQISANLLRPDGEFTPIYQKQKTLPFAEDVPFRRELPWLTDIFGERFFEPGVNAEPLLVPLPRGPERRVLRPDVKLATRICYEDILPELFQQMMRRSNAHLLLALTNEQWFGKSQASNQHALQAVWRAVENRRYMLRVTTTGKSLVVDPLGQIIADLPRFEAAAVTVQDIPLLQSVSLFTRVGLLPLKALGLMALLLSLLPLATISFAKHGAR